MSQAESAQKLPDGVVPLSQESHFEPDLESLDVRGSTRIKLEVIKPTDRITLNARELALGNPQLFVRLGQETQRILIPMIEPDTQGNTVTFVFAEQIPAGKVELAVDFRNTLRGDLTGFYVASFTDAAGKSHNIATTHMEPHYARRMVPIFDQPDLKIPHTISVTVPPGLQAVSNMPIASGPEGGVGQVVKFEQTPPMSSYLLYLGVGEFDTLEGRIEANAVRAHDVALRVVTTPGKSQQGQFALEEVKRGLAWQESYSGVAFPLPKLDILAIPDFGAGAMENWGAIAFREIYVLVGPETSTSMRKRVAYVNAHELWHQWSGNLVTMRWWNDLWLNESFATLVGYKTVDALHPNWNTWEDFLLSDTVPAMEMDSLVTSHPIDVEVKSADDVDGLFDKISYGKGGSVLRMIEAYLGEETFRLGVSNYLKQFAFSNATAADLWHHFAQAAGNPQIEAVMESWIKQAGHPVVEVSVDGNKLTLRQKRLGHGLENNNQTWMIPLVINVPGQKPIKHLMTKDLEEITLDAAPDVVKVNDGQVGFYRVKYDARNLSKLSGLVASKQLPVFDRWGVQNDLFHLSLAGEVPLSAYLDFVFTYQGEDSFLVLNDIYHNVKHIGFVFSAQKDNVRQIQERTKAPFKNQLERLGWQPKTGESSQDAQLRVLSIDYLAMAGDEDVLQAGKTLFEQHLAGQQVHPDLRKSVYSIAASTGAATYEKLVEMFGAAKDSAEERKIIIEALASFEKPEALRASMEFMLSDKVKPQDWRYVFPAMGANPAARPVFWQMVKSCWDTIAKQRENPILFVNFMLDSIITAYTGADQEREMRAFFAEKKAGYEKRQESAFATMRRNTDWAAKNADGLAMYSGKAV